MEGSTEHVELQRVEHTAFSNAFIQGVLFSIYYLQEMSLCLGKHSISSCLLLLKSLETMQTTDLEKPY